MTGGAQAAAQAAAHAAERAARDACARLLALLAARTRDLVLAEDALSQAFAAAMQAWPRGGVPDRPEAWLITAAKRGTLTRALGPATDPALRAWLARRLG